MAKRKFGGGYARRIRRKYAKRSGYRSRRRGIRKGTLLKVARTAVLKQTETKNRTIATENVQLYHNGGVGGNYVVQSNLLQTPVGTSQVTRVGDEVFGVGLKVRLWLSNKSDRPNVMYRVMIVSVPVEYASVTSPSNLFKNDVGNKMLDPVDTDRYKVIYHRVFNPAAGDFSLETGATNKEHSRLVSVYIPLKNRRIKYNTDGGSTPSYQRNCLSLVVIPYDAWGSTTGDNIASMAYHTKFYFKDP